MTTKVVALGRPHEGVPYRAITWRRNLRNGSERACWLAWKATSALETTAKLKEFDRFDIPSSGSRWTTRLSIFA